MKFKVRFLQIALDDLTEIVVYIARDSKIAAQKMHDKLVAAAYQLEDFPKIGVPVPEPKMRKAGFRMLIVGKYLLLYKIIDDEINILRILHGAKDYSRLLR